MMHNLNLVYLIKIAKLAGKNCERIVIDSKVIYLSITEELLIEYLLKNKSIVAFIFFCDQKPFLIQKGGGGK